MASQPPAQMPLLYKELVPLSNQAHANFKSRGLTEAPYLAKTHAVPILIDEFISSQRFFPIIFSLGENPVPLALMGLNEGVNTFVDDKGMLLQATYVPAYLRRYPFMLARLEAGSDNLSLCFDPASDMVGDYEEGERLFDGEGKPTEATQKIMKFCEEFEISAQRTNAFVKELSESGLLIDGEVAIQLNDGTQPFIYRGFKMVDENKFRELSGDKLRKFSQNGMLPLIMAHLFSLSMTREIFLRQMNQGKGPQPIPAEAPEAAQADA